jgi:magnesium transporter
MELSHELFVQFRQALREKAQDEVLRLLEDWHPTDLAQVFHDLSIEEADYLYTVLDPDLAAEILTELDEQDRERFLSRRTARDIAEKFVENLDSDDAADILSELPEERQREILAEINDPEVASDIVDLLQYDEYSAGGLMAKEMVRIREDWSRDRIIQEIREQASEIENVYSVYVVDEQDRLKGLMPLKRLLIEPDHVPLHHIYIDKVVYVDVHTPREKVAQTMQKYDLVAMPVVDQLGRLVGRITIDDVVDVMQEEAGKDYQLLSGLSEDVESDDHIWPLTRARIPWLLVGLMGGILGANVISQYEDQIQIHPEMAYFIPLIAAMGGNAGVQSSAIIVQGLANNSLRKGAALNKFLKELAVGLLNGLVCALVVLAYNLLFSNELPLALTVGSSLLTVIVTASVMGTFIPLTLNKFGVDPALATGPFITTMNDILGIFIYFLTGRIMYAYLA